MNTLKLCDAIDWQLQLAGVKGEDAEIVKKCVARYTHGEGIKEELCYLFYRICNAAKRLFGQPSDWQLAQKALENHAFSYIPFPCRGFAKQRLQAEVHFLAGKVLQFLVWENEKKLGVPEFAKAWIEYRINAVKNVVAQALHEVLQDLNLQDSILEIAKKLLNLWPSDVKLLLITLIRSIHPLPKTSPLLEKPTVSQ